MGGSMKKQIVLLAAVIAAAATVAFAGTSIVGTAHDLSATGANSASYALGADEICIYCHTPHNPVQAIPLWNRNNPSASLFSLYKTSPTLTSATKGSSFSANSISLFCMSCHDGVTALGNISKPSGNTMNGTKVIEAGRGDKLGQNLTNSHPVGFNYASAASADSTLWPIASAKVNLGTTTGGSEPFFNDGLTFGSMMECASCHKVHNDEYGKFLRQTNAKSALCLDCHNK
jgi:predicted CXXCH cytochrome family protein